MARNRIIYASQSVWCNGEVLYRVQSLGSTTTFTSEDIFELGHLDIVDVVDDVPAVAVTLNTNDFGDVRTLAVLAQLHPDKRVMDASATSDTGNLVVVDGPDFTPTATFLHGVALADFAVVCGNLPGVSLWAPVQDECSLGTLDNNIDQTLFLDELYINSLEFGYTTGANATENYGAETDVKCWFLNAGKFVNYDDFDSISAATITGTGYLVLTLASGNDVASLTMADPGFVRKTEDGAPGITWYDESANEVMNVEVSAGVAAASGMFIYHDTGSEHRLYFPTEWDETYAGDRIEAIYSANGYGTGTSNKYFDTLDDANRPDMLGAIRQGQVEIYIVDPANPGAGFENAWRLTGCTITSDLTREALAELGHLGPYDRPLTLPIPITVTVDSTAGDLENWAKFAGQKAGFDADSIDDLCLADLMGEEDLKLVVKIFAQTDEEANGTGANRVVAAGSPLVGQSYWSDGVMDGPYTGSGSEQEMPLKTIVVEHLKITDEGATLDMGANMTQTFGFRSTNDLYVIKGDISLANISGSKTVRRNG